MKKPYNRILAKMLAKFAVDAEPEELEEAVDAIEDITTEEPTQQPPVEDCKDEDPFKTINDRLDALEAKMNAPAEDEEPEEVPEEDPLEKLENDLDEIANAPAAEEEEEEIVTPDEDPDEAEAHFVDPEEINEQDEDEVVEEEEEEEIPVADKRACDAARAALKVVKPIIASLPPAQRKKAADKAVAQIRKISGMDAIPKKNSYVALKAKRKAADSKADPSDIGRKIMEARNPQYKK